MPPVNLNQPSLQNNPFAPTLQRGTNQFGSDGAIPTIVGTQYPQTTGVQNASVTQASAGGGGVSKSSPLSEAITGGAGGVGSYMNSVGQAQQSAQGQVNNLSGEVSNLYQRQGENATNAAGAVMNATPAGSDIDPYAQMALKKALIDGYTPQSIQAPQGINQGTVSGGLDLSALKGPMDQFYDPAAIRASMQEQQQLRNNVDPNTPQDTAGLQIYGQDYQPNYDANVSSAAGAQSRQNYSQGQAQQALKDAISQTQKGAKGSILGGIGSFLAGAAPGALKMIGL